MLNRRAFLMRSAVLAAGLPFVKNGQAFTAAAPMFFRISLAEWSLHRTLRAGKMTNLDFPIVAKRDFGIEAVEYVNQFFKDKAQDKAYLRDLKQRCDDNGVRSLLIMCDGEGELGELDKNKRRQAVENHYKWVEAAQFLGCHSIRVNTLGSGSEKAVAKASVDALRRLSDFAKPYNINVIVENHGGYSGYDGWLARVMRRVNRPNCGILPDFGNFCVRYEGAPWSTPCAEWTDRYKVTTQFMPYAKGVSAKSYDFDAKGNCVETDYDRMMRIVKDSGYRGYVGIEYEGNQLDEYAGIRATKTLLERVGAQLGA